MGLSLWGCLSLWSLRACVNLFPSECRNILGISILNSLTHYVYGMANMFSLSSKYVLIVNIDIYHHPSILAFFYLSSLGWLLSWLKYFVPQCRIDANLSLSNGSNVENQIYLAKYVLDGPNFPYKTKINFWRRINAYYCWVDSINWARKAIPCGYNTRNMTCKV